jgi:hypothetical protein
MRRGRAAILAADVNGDGDQDLVCANRASGSVTVLANDGVGGFALPVHFAAGSRPCDVVGVDLDGDDDTDVAVANAGAGSLSLLFNTTSPVPVLLVRWAATETAQGTVLLTWGVDDGAAVLGFGSSAGMARRSCHDTDRRRRRAPTRTPGATGVVYRYVLVAVDRRGSTVRSAGVGSRSAPCDSALGSDAESALVARRSGSACRAMAVHVALFDVRGKRVAELVDTLLPRGCHAALVGP